MESNRQKQVSGDKGSLTEQQTNRTGTTMIQIKRKHNTNCTTQRAALLNRCRALPSRELVSSVQLPSSTGTQHEAHGMEYPALFGHVGSARPAMSLPGFQ